MDYNWITIRRQNKMPNDNYSQFYFYNNRNYVKTNNMFLNRYFCKII